jgi:hypothetical protein
MMKLYKDRGVAEEIEGDTAVAARNWLEQAKSELPGVKVLIDAGQYRMAYRAGFDIMRNATEAVVTRAGYRVTSRPGHHEAVFAIANALDTKSTGVFGGARSSQSRMKRGSSNYVDVDQSAEITKGEAQTIYSWASEAIAAAEDILG